MSEAPTGPLAWGQAGIYDAIDDRLVIAAVTRYRTGLTWPIEVAAGTGLNVIVRGGWVGVADCGDRTSAVVGSRVDTTVTAIPGPATGSREDLIWVDTQPDQGTWIMRVITETDAAGRFGLGIGRITVPPNATLASQMDIRPVGASLERRLMLQNVWNQVNQTRNEQTWADAAANTFAVGHVPLEPGQWYKARFTATSPLALTGTINGRIGIGMRTEGQPANASDLGRANVIAYRQLGAAQAAAVEWVFRHPPGSARVNKMFDGRIWAAGTGTFYCQSVSAALAGDGMQITIEDIGS
jgi:hypothetical protein